MAKRSAALKNLRNRLAGKLKEALTSVLPITGIVLLLNFTVSPMPPLTLALFLFASVFLILGMGLFTVGADMSMITMGERLGSKLTSSRKLLLLIITAFLIGVFITIAEPDLTVLASQVQTIPSTVLILSVAVGVGAFLVIALLRIIFQIRLSYLLIGFYVLVFILAAFATEGFVSIAFDSGGVTTGPMTVPFILALGIGVAAVRGGKNAQDDSFGLVALCSVGPILAVLLLDMFYDTTSISYAEEVSVELNNAGEIFTMFASNLPTYFREVAVALLPIVGFFILFQIFFLKIRRRTVIKIAVGLAYTYVGLVLFLTGVNVGFMPIGHYLGTIIGGLDYNWILIPIGGLIGFFVVMAEPAVHVLNRQVEEVTVGAVSRRAMLMSLSIGVACSVVLAMIRVLTGLSIWYLILPGYAIALGLSFVVPRVFTAIAFDSGGVASGPMTATFLLPFAMGACGAAGGNILTDAFGIVAMVAMTPLITIQISGLVFKFKQRHTAPVTDVPSADTDDEVIDL